jgi:hypothetical protein
VWRDFGQVPGTFLWWGFQDGPLSCAPRISKHPRPPNPGSRPPSSGSAHRSAGCCRAPSQSPFFGSEGTPPTAVALTGSKTFSDPAATS